MTTQSTSLIRAVFLIAACAACSDDPAAAPATPDAAPVTQPDAAPPAPDAPPAPPPVGLTLLDGVIAVDITPDGRTAVYEQQTPFEITLVFHDTVTGVSTPRTTVGDPARNLATGVSSTGQVTALHGEPVRAGVYSEPGGWVDLDSPHPVGCGEDLGAAWDISADGHVVVGMMWDGCAPSAFRWKDGTLTVLERLGSAFDEGHQPSNRATVVSDDGSVAAGFAENGALDRTPALWHADGTGELLDPFQTDAPGEVLSISADGRTLAGITGYDGFVWTRGTGLAHLVRFADALPSDPVYPNAMTADGRVIFGGVGDAFFGVPIAFAWTGPGGMVRLDALAAAAGITIPDGVLLNNVLGASTDGSVLLGVATAGNTATKIFVLRLPAGTFTR